jgi:hypothetical protein
MVLPRLSPYGYHAGSFDLPELSISFKALGMDLNMLLGLLWGLYLALGDQGLI